MALREFHQLFTTRFRKRNPARVAEGRHNINRFNGFFAHQRFEFVDDHAVAISAYGFKFRLRQAEHLQGSEIGWALDNDGIAGVNQRPRQHVQGLLRTGCHYHVIGFTGNAAPFTDALNFFAQSRHAFGQTVLKGFAKML